MMAKQYKTGVMGHLEELFRRLRLCLAVLFCTITASFYPAKYVIMFLKTRSPGVELIYTKPTEMIGTYIQVSLYLGIALALPFIVYEALMFISPALTQKEKRYLFTLIPAIIFFFVGGVAFSYFILLPPGMKFMLNFGSDIATPMISVSSYVGLLSKLMFWTGIIFEIPIIMYFFSKIGITDTAWFAKKRKWAIVGAFVLAALITPTVDPVNQILLAGPIIMLYEIGIWAAKLARMRSKPRLVAQRVTPQGI